MTQTDIVKQHVHAVLGRLRPRLFEELAIGERFDCRTHPHCYEQCVKISERRFRSLSTGVVYRYRSDLRIRACQAYTLALG